MATSTEVRAAASVAQASETRTMALAMFCLLLVSYTLMSADRYLISMLGTDIRAALGLTLPQMGALTTMFTLGIGIAGLPALKRYVGQRDPEGYELRVTEIAVADEIAGAAELVMGKLDRCPVALVRGFTLDEPAETAQEYVRPADRDLFR